MVEEPAVEEAVADESTEVTDPDDIDALLAAAAEPAVEAPVVKEPASEENTEVEEGAEESTISAEDEKIKNEIAENEAKIAEFTAEYVTPFLTADFSDIIAKEGEPELKAESIANTQSEIDEFDIDALIADAESLGDNTSDEDVIKEDIGDSLTADVEARFT